MEQGQCPDTAARPGSKPAVSYGSAHHGEFQLQFQLQGLELLWIGCWKSVAVESLSIPRATKMHSFPGVSIFLVLFSPAPGGHWLFLCPSARWFCVYKH